MTTMTTEELVLLSGIKDNPNFRELDYAIPFNHQTKTYPYDGKAISVYGNDGSFKLVPYTELAMMAKDRLFDKWDKYFNEAVSKEGSDGAFENLCAAHTIIGYLKCIYETLIPSPAKE